MQIQIQGSRTGPHSRADRKHRCNGLILRGDFTIADFPPRKFWICSITRRRAFGNCVRLLASGFGFSLNTGNRRPLPPNSRRLVSIGTAGGRFGSTLAGGFPPAADATPGRRIARIFRLIHNPLETSMKRNRRRLPIPQHEFGFVPDTFTLIQDTGLDGERLTRERDEADRARMLAEAAQAALFTPTKSRKR